MGSWGFESCSNDDCWDSLYARNIHKMTQKECDFSIGKAIISNRKSKRGVSDRTVVGVATWVLNQGRLVDVVYLDYVLKCATRMLKSSDIDCYTESKTRRAAIRSEIRAIKAAIKNYQQKQENQS